MRWAKYLSRYSVAQIAKHVGVSSSTVYRWRRLNRIPSAQAERVRSIKAKRKPKKAKKRSKDKSKPQRSAANWKPWPKYLDKYPLESIADFISERDCPIKEVTVRQWKRDGFIPKRCTKALSAMRRVYIAGPARRKKILRDTNTFRIIKLVDQAGHDVSIEEVRRWKVRKEIPLKYRTWLMDDTLEVAVPPKPLGARTIEVRKGISRTVSAVKWDYDEPLTDSSMIEILNTVEQQTTARPTPNTHYQFFMKGEAMLSDTSPLLMKSIDLLNYEKKRGLQQYGFRLFADADTSYRVAVSHFQVLMSTRMRYDITLETVGVLVRTDNTIKVPSIIRKK